MKKIINRLVAILPAIILQVAWYILIFGFIRRYSTVFSIIMTIFAVLFVLVIITRVCESSYKILWLLVILTMPVLGAWLYFFFGNRKTVRPIIKKLDKAREKIRPVPETDKKIIAELEKDNIRMSKTFKYLTSRTSFPVVYNKSAKYYKIGEDMYKDMLKDIKNAKKFIFLEYFIIEEGKFLDSILKILEQKVKEGLDVRILYDDLGSIKTYSLRNAEQLTKKGIKCMPFNPLIFIKTTLNNRDHRKMLVIDNEIVYSGGINIADEYINEKERFGHWKDIGFKLTGEAVDTYTYMFIEFWNAFSEDKISNDYLLKKYENQNFDDGYVLSYYDSPINTYGTSNNLYVDLLYQAVNYAWYYTPYLILGDELMEAFIKAARRGVDIRIIVPGIPDKKIINRLTKSYYKPLMDAGIKIYEYKPGFIHAKATIIDDKVCTIGSVNLDYRSLFLHFECNTLFYKAGIIKNLKKDFDDTLKFSYKVNAKDLKKNFLHIFFDSILRIFAPLC